MERKYLRKRVTRTAPRLRRQVVDEAEPTVRRMFAEGANDRQIMVALNMPSITHIQTVRNCRRQLGLTRLHIYHPISEAELALVAPLVDDGISTAEIARRTGMSEARLRNLFLKYGLGIGSYEKRACRVPRDHTNRWAAALAGRLFTDAKVRAAPIFRALPPITHIETQSTAAMAAL